MNKKIKILLVEDNQNTIDVFRSHIDSSPLFTLSGVTGSEYAALAFLEADDIHVVVLDLELAEGNGIDFAEKMRNLSIAQPFVIVTTNNCSQSVQQYLRSELKVDFIFQKTNPGCNPPHILNLIEKTYKYHCNSAHIYYDLRSELKSKLDYMGFHPQKMGTRYILDALVMIHQDSTEPLLISKTIYPALASIYEVTPGAIERAMRIEIEYVWSNISQEKFEKYYPYEITAESKRPSNGEFLNNLAGKSAK